MAKLVSLPRRLASSEVEGRRGLEDAVERRQEEGRGRLGGWLRRVLVRYRAISSLPASPIPSSPGAAHS
jgi:hypothetical protein